MLKELGVADKPTLLVLNKVDRVSDLSFLQVLQAHHPRAVAVSATTGQGLDELQSAVIEMLSADFAPVEVDVDAGNGKVLSYLAAHAEIHRQQFHDNNRVTLHCYLPRHLVRHIRVTDVHIRLLDEPPSVNGEQE